MPSLSPVEIMVVAMLALIVFGPDKLPGIARTIGRTFNDLRRMADEARTEFRSGFDAPVADEPVTNQPVSADPMGPEPAPEPEKEGPDEHGSDRPQ